MFDFRDKVVLITGAAQGFGRVCALAFAERGAKVAICDLNDDGGAETLRQIRAAGAQGFYRHADVAKEDDVAQLVAQTVAVKAATPPRYVRVRDAAGNYSRWRRVSRR